MFTTALTDSNKKENIESKELNLIQFQMKSKQRKLDRLDDKIFDLISEKGDEDDCVEEVREAGEFKVKIQRSLLTIEDLLKPPAIVKCDSLESASSVASSVNGSKKKSERSFPNRR